MLRLTRLNHQTIVINPDHVFAAEAAPDTTLRLLGGETILVRESLDELIELIVAYRRRIRDGEPTDAARDARAVAAITQRHALDADEEDA